MVGLAIQLKGINKSYGNLVVMKDFNIAFPQAKTHCLFGPSGCGKTTLLNVLTGLVKPDRGSITGLEGKTISYIFQEHRLLPWATVEENILFVLNGHGNSEGKKIAKEYLSLVGLWNFKDSYPEQLSGGMKQRVAIARGLAHEGDILVMDEPFKGLDGDIKRKLMNHIIKIYQQREKEKKSIIFITHDIDEALYLSDLIHIFQGTPLTLTKQLTIPIPHSQRSSNNMEIMKYRQKFLSKIQL